MEVIQYHFLRNINVKHNTTAQHHNTTPHKAQETTEYQKRAMQTEKLFLITNNLELV
jgi:hypothetical protein